MARDVVKGTYWCAGCGKEVNKRLESDDLGPQCVECMSGKITPIVKSGEQH